MNARAAAMYALRLLTPVLLLCGGAGALRGQSLHGSDTLRAAAGDTLRLSNDWIVPYSEQLLLPGNPVKAFRYRIDYQRGLIFWEDSSLSQVLLVVRYRYFSAHPPNTVMLRRWVVRKDSSPQAYQDVFFPPPGSDFSIDDGSRLRKSGSLTRGITVGNNQSLAINSGLRLQIEGDLGDGLMISGAITDENIPIQPDGSTQQLSDLDKVFIRLQKGPMQVTLGDFELTQRGTAFTDFYRNVQGLQAGYQTKQLRSSVSAAAAKGKFHNNVIQGIEGVSGPYRLTGRNGERFFTVLAGSEAVYLNGKRLLRGESNDYVINYNTAELYFTNRNFITVASRIVVDFEYTDLYYNRSLMVATGEWQSLDGRFQVKSSYSRDADNPNAPIDGPENFGPVRDILSRAGDDPLLAVSPGATETGFSATEPRYALRDTLVGARLYSIYVLSQQPDEAIYRVVFSFTGAGNGDYVRAASGQNTSVYRWVAPDPLSGRSRGEFAPVRQWALPRLLQVAGARMSWQLSDRFQLFNESALSSDDRNRLSALDDADNAGFAQRSGFTLTRLPLADSLHLSTTAAWQYTGERFQNLDRVYKAEYNRVWDLRDANERANEHTTTANLQLDWKGKLQLGLEQGARLAGPGNTAWRQVLSANSAWPRLIQGQMALTRIRTQTLAEARTTRWDRWEGNLYVPAKWLRPGVEIWIEQRDERFADSLSAQSFRFTDLKPYLRHDRSKRFQAELSLNYRKEQQVQEGLLRDKLLGLTWAGRARWQPVAPLDLQANVSYRNFRLLDTVFRSQGLADARILNANLQGAFTPRKRILSANFLYEIAGERTARKEVRFIQVNPGQGQYVWLDSLFNNDGIQQVDEFQIANNPLIANFIRVVFPTQELFPSVRSSFTGSFRLDLNEAIPASRKNVAWQTLKSTRAYTSFRINQNKAQSSGFRQYLIPLGNLFADSSLLDADYSLRQDLTFFQNSKGGDLRLSFQDSRNKLFLNTGDEFRGLSYLAVAPRVNLSPERSLESEFRSGNKFTRAESFNTRNFNIIFREVRPKLNLQLNQSLRLSGGYEFRYRANRNDSMRIDARVWTHKALFEGKWNIKNRNNLNLTLELIGLRQQGQTVFAADYELKEGLRPGFNAIWQAFFTFFPFKDLEFSINYDGRASPDVRVIHTGRLQVRAFF